MKTKLLKLITNKSHIAKWILIACILPYGCGDSFLDIKTNRNDVMPYRIADYQAILDNASRIMNVNTAHTLGTIAAAESFVDPNVLENFYPVHQRNAYAWVKDNFYEGDQSQDWNYAFNRILYCNQVLAGLSEIEPAAGEVEDWNRVKGSALFFRAYTYYQLAQLFCRVYDLNTANTNLGLPLRTEPDITVKVGRSNLKDTYDFIVGDLMQAQELLPQESENLHRPSRAAVHAFFARLYLQMREYGKAKEQARLALDLTNATLMDYNLLTLNPNAFDSFIDYQGNHPEVMFYSYMRVPEIATLGLWGVNDELYAEYEENDLRKTVFFKEFNGGRIYIGTYSGVGFPFTGLAANELYLIISECSARGGDMDGALAYLNALREKRYVQGAYIPLSSTDPNEIIREVLKERRKELVFKGLRWEDIRRLNVEGSYPVDIAKVVSGHTVEIEPNDPRYVFPIPENAVQLGGLEQNNR